MKLEAQSQGARAVNPVFALGLGHDEDDEYDGAGVSSADEEDENTPANAEQPAVAFSQDHALFNMEDAKGSDNSDSSALSSPVFANAKTNGGDHLDSSGEENYRPGYTYGYRRRPAAKTHQRQPSQDFTPEIPPVKDTGPDPIQDARVEPQGADPKSKDKATDRGEWVVLDMGDENGVLSCSLKAWPLIKKIAAFSSMLRILHRHSAHPISSTFTSALPSMSSTPMGLPSPPLGHDHDGQSFQAQQSLESLEKSSSGPDTILNQLPATLPTISDTPPSQRTPQHPMSLISTAQSLSNTFGALPYPEWRSQVTDRARRAGIGQVGRAMETFLFGSPLESSAPTGRKSRDRRKRPIEPDELGLSSEARRGRRRESTMTMEPSPISSSVTESDSGEESSETEWLGWLGDLHRQARVTRAQQLLEQLRLHELQQETYDYDDPYQEPRNHLPETFSESQAQATRRFIEDRRALEPSGTVISLSHDSNAPIPPNQPGPPPSSPASASSSARARALSFSFSPTDPTPLSTSSSPGHTHTHSVSISHQFSNDDPMLQNVATRRPSMPTILHGPTTSSFMVSSGTGSGSTSASPPRSAIITSGSPPRGNNFGSLPVGPNCSISTVITTGSNTVPRRASTSGLISAAGSVGRSSSILSRGPGLLRRKDGDQIREKERLKREEMLDTLPQRPRLAVSTSTQTMGSSSSSSTAASQPTGTVRRVRSGSSLVSTAEDMASVTSSTESNLSSRKNRKNLVRGVSKRAERFVRGLDSALDFVDGR